MAQFNLNRKWIFEDESNYPLLHPGDAGRTDRTQEGHRVPGTPGGDVARARMDEQKRINYEERS